jgi:hypothetical protein
MDSDMQRLDYTQVAPALTIAKGLMNMYNRRFQQTIVSTG